MESNHDIDGQTNKKIIKSRWAKLNNTPTVAQENWPYFPAKQGNRHLDMCYILSLFSKRLLPP